MELRIIDWIWFRIGTPYLLSYTHAYVSNIWRFLNNILEFVIVNVLIAQ